MGNGWWEWWWKWLRKMCLRNCRRHGCITSDNCPTTAIGWLRRLVGSLSAVDRGQLLSDLAPWGFRRLPSVMEEGEICRVDDLQVDVYEAQRVFSSTSTPQASNNHHEKSSWAGNMPGTKKHRHHLDLLLLLNGLRDFLVAATSPPTSLLVNSCECSWKVPQKQQLHCYQLLVPKTETSLLSAPIPKKTAIVNKSHHRPTKILLIVSPPLALPKTGRIPIS